MSYRVYSGPRGCEDIPPLEKHRWLFKQFAMLDEALGWAQHVSDRGGVALLIEGDDGTMLNRRSIAQALSSRERSTQRVLHSDCAASASERGGVRAELG